MFLKNVCNVNKKLSECNSITKIKEWQNEFEKIKNIHIENLIIDYLDSDIRRAGRNIICTGDSMYFFIECLVKSENKYKNFEERFQEFGKQLDEYAQKDKMVNDLKNKIKAEKDKLGIK